LISEKFEGLYNWKELLEKQSQALEWNSSKNSSIKGNLRHLPLSEYLEDIANILFQYDIAVICMNQYIDALDLHRPNSYENFMNSINISSETIHYVNEVLIKSKNIPS
jgi:phosphomevalonate kinase